MTQKRHTTSIALSGHRKESLAHVSATCACTKMADGPIGVEDVATEPQSADSKRPKEQVVDPWNVSAAEGEDKIDYDKLISECRLVMNQCSV